MDKCPGLRDVAVLGTLPALRVLKLQNMAVGIDDLAWLRSLSCLEELMLAVEVSTLDWTIPFGMPALKRLVIRSHAGYAASDADILALAEAAGRTVTDFSRGGTNRLPNFAIDMA